MEPEEREHQESKDWDGTVTVGNQTWKPTLPSSDMVGWYHMVRSVWLLSVQDPQLAFAAALCLTWRGKRPPKVSWRAHKRNAVEFAAACIDELHRRGLDPMETYAAGAQCWRLFVDAAMPQGELNDARDFS